MKHSTSNWHPDAVDSDAPSSASGVGRTSSAPALLRKQCPACGERYPAHFLVCPSDATQLRDASNVEVDPLIGAVLAETYELRRVIGEGGMGSVYEARHTRLFSKRFAIKVLHGDLTRQPEVVDRFLREAEATSALHHPNIVGVLDVNQLPDGRPYIVAELLEGQQLGDYFERHGKLASEEAVAICRPICHALMAAHGKDIVHRDIKPENLFLVGEGEQRTTKVLDFGISRVGDAAGSNTKTGMILGTPAYMPPEQARGQRVDHRADIYAVGAILYEAVTGKAPFESDDPIATLGAVLTQSPVSPRSFAPDLSAGLELVIQKAMAKSPDDRYASMREFDAALAEFDRGPHRRSYERPSHEPSPEHALRHASGMRARLRRAYASNAPELARKRMWLLSTAMLAFLFAGLLALSVSLLRISMSGATPTDKALLICALASAGVLSVPSIVWANFLFWHVALSTSRVLDVSSRIGRVLAVSLSV
ncbi:MAG TPA: serine/threonine-protein kinase, partial [Polyangiales bacterium]|nr:serine/threonine-protein kinase [Polyangiales bacterium]